MSGIYKIVNQANNKIYIGRTYRNFESRWSEHIEQLNSNEHVNYELQKDWNKHGQGSFKFGIVEEISDKFIIPLKEIIYIAKYTNHNCYNETIRRSVNTIRAIDRFISDDNFIVYIECKVNDLIWSMVIKDLVNQKVYYYLKNIDGKKDKDKRLEFINQDDRRVLVNILKPIRNYHKTPNELYEMIIQN